MLAKKKKKANYLIICLFKKPFLKFQHTKCIICQSPKLWFLIFIDAWNTFYTTITFKKEIFHHVWNFDTLIKNN
ncbi:hypothetical protein CQZ70_02425 [Mesoplasma florum]|nr:hypothetical protein CQZ70_02425 [Mesoplasma florum]